VNIFHFFKDPNKTHGAFGFANMYCLFDRALRGSESNILELDKLAVSIFLNYCFVTKK
jgi:hypothetical protein